MRQISAIVCILLACQNLFGAAFNATVIWRTSTLGSDSNGGAFDPGVGSPGTDESTGAGTTVTITLLGTGTTATSSAAFTSTTHGPGNFLQVTVQLTGTCTLGTYEILSQAAGTATVNVSMGTAAATCTAIIGGPALTIGHAAGLVVAGNNVCIKADGTYSISSNVAVSVAGSNALPIIWQGYTSTCGVGGAASDQGQATIQESAALTGMITVTGNYNQFYNLILDCNSQAGTARGVNITTGTPILVDNVKAQFCATDGIKAASAGTLVSNSRVTGGLSGCTSGFTSSNTTTGIFVDSIADANNCPGFLITTSASCIRCIGAGNLGASGDGIKVTSGNDSILILGSALYGNAGSGLNFSVAGGPLGAKVKDNWFWGNTSHSIAANASLSYSLIFNYNAYASGSLSNVKAGPNDITLTADPSVAGGSLNFALNSTAGGGAALKAAGFPGVLQSGGTGYLDIGPLQSQSSGGGQVSYAQ